MQQQQTISRLDCDMRPKVDSIQLVMTSSVAGLRSSKAFPKASLHQRKGDGHCLVVCCWSDPLQLSESWRNHYIWEVCSANQWDAPKTATAAPGIGQQNGPNSFARQRPVNWDMNFCLTCHSHLITHQPTTTSSISTTFCRENTSITSKRQEMLS